MNIKVIKRLYLLGTAITFIAVLGACSARRNTAPSRFYHALNSRYNIYFNGKTSFDEALKSMNDDYKENYTEQIYLLPVSGIYKVEKSTTGGAFDRAITKGNKAIKLHSIKEKPPRKSGWRSDPRQVKRQAQEEFNPFTKHCWLLVAESHFYNGDFLSAAVTYSYIARHFSTDAVVVAEARIGQALCYTEMNWFYEANTLIKKLNESGVPRSVQNKYERMYADYLIKSGQTEQSLLHLQNVIKAERNKRQRSRQLYLLGQLYMQTGQRELAYKTFDKVARSNPPYEIEFASRIRQTEAFTSGDYNKVLKTLRRMAKSDKNKDYLDQVYYALGNVYMTRQDTANAIDAYVQGIEKSTQNGMDKAICQIRLGDIYFTQKKYIDAQPCFGGALVGINKEYKDYDRVARLSETLDELVIHYEAVYLQDSLQTLARMPEEERLAAIDKIIAQVIEEEKKAEEEAKKESYLAEQASIGSNLNVPRKPNMPVAPVAGRGENAFYFYNPQVVAQGKTQFQSKWGKRSLEDDWRRRNKKMTLMQQPDDEALSPENVTATDPTKSSDPSINDAETDTVFDAKSREYYLQQIPLTDEDIETSNIIIVDGLFNMGMIYKDKLEDMNLAVGTFEELERRFPDNKYRLDYYYQICLLAMRNKDAGLAETYIAKMLATFPESDFTRAVSDPDYEYNIRMMSILPDSIYEATYRLYLSGDTAAVRRNYTEVNTKYPLTPLMPKFMFLDALTYVQSGDVERFKDALTALTEKYPTEDVTALASEMLKGLLRGRKLMQGSFSTMTWDLRFGLSEDGTLSDSDAARAFSSEQQAPHRMLLIYNNGNVDRNQLLYAVAAYNFARLRTKGLDLSIQDAGTLTILTISGFISFDEIMDYYRKVYESDGYAPAYDGVVALFPISDDNYDILMHGKTLEEYMTFFVESYGATATDVANRWRVRIDADRKAEEAKIKQSTVIEKPISTPTEKEQTDVDKPATTLLSPEKADTIETVEPIALPVIETDQPAEPKTEQIEASEEDDEEEARPAAKGENIFKRLFKRLRETKEYKTMQESLQTIKDMAGEDETPSDSVVSPKPLERVDGELTLEQLQEIRKREADRVAAQEAEIALSKEEARREAELLKKKQEKERKALLKQKAKDAKARQRQKEKERREKANAKKKAERKNKK